jgi:hypothetical protein
MARLRLNPERVLTSTERWRRSRDRRRGLPVPEVPRLETPGRALAEAMEACGVPLASFDDIPSTVEVFAGLASDRENVQRVGCSPTTPAPAEPLSKPCAMVGSATPLRFDPKALIG